MLYTLKNEKKVVKSNMLTAAMQATVKHFDDDQIKIICTNLLKKQGSKKGNNN